tara:strand:- start:2751 stop:3983 length:1233 start_codon:yes stop_codon:yes gene_type:complete
MGTGGSLNDIRDDEDFPHVGIIKALADGLGQNFAVSGFNATNISATSVDIADGKIFRDGKLVTITGDTLTISAGSGTGNTYALLVAPASGNVTRRLNTVRGKTPSITAGDTIIGVLVHTGSNPMQLQYLTLDKTENSVSIGQNNSSTAYIEEGKITAPTGSSGQGIDIVTTTTNSDIRITPNGSGKIILDGLNWPIADGGANQVLKTDGGGQLSFVAQTSLYSDANAISAVEGEATLALSGDVSIASGKTLTVDSDLELSVSSNDVVIKNTNQDNDMIFKVNDGGADTEVMRILGNAANVGIGTATPAEKFSVSGNIRSSGDVIIGNALDHNGTTVGFYGTTPVARPNVGNGSFAPNPAAFGRPAVDPSANPGFEPNVDNYMSILEQEIMTISTKLNDLIDALQLQGLIL